MIFDHLGVVVASLEAGRSHLEQLLGVQDWSASVEDPLQRVLVQFGWDASGVCYELIAPAGEEGPLREALRTGKNILNHVAYRVPDLEAAMDRARSLGSMPLGPPRPAVAFQGRRVVFLLTRLRMILELIEETPSLPEERPPHHA